MPRELRVEDFNTLLLRGVVELGPDLEKLIVGYFRKAIEDVFRRPEQVVYHNLGTLKTKAGGIIISRWDTLHALLKAAHANQKKAFRLAGYEAGVLFGVGIIRWFLERSREVWGEEGLPVDTLALLENISAFDTQSGWAEIELTQDEASPDCPRYTGWKGTVNIRNHFLAYGWGQARQTNRASETEATERLRNYELFWASYLEGTYSAALGAWYGTRVCWGQTEKPFFVARCEKQSNGLGHDLVLRVEVCRPIYPVTCQAVQSELLIPMIQDELDHVHSSTRKVIDKFVHELAGVGAAGNENIPGALDWLCKFGPNEGRNAASWLRQIRTTLHAPHHEFVTDKEKGEREAYAAFGKTVPVAFMAMRDIQLDRQQTEAFAKALSTPPTD